MAVTLVTSNNPTTTVPLGTVSNSFPALKPGEAYHLNVSAAESFTIGPFDSAEYPVWLWVASSTSSGNTGGVGTAMLAGPGTATLIGSSNLQPSGANSVQTAVAISDGLVTVTTGGAGFTVRIARPELM